MAGWAAGNRERRAAGRGRAFALVLLVLAGRPNPVSAQTTTVPAESVVPSTGAERSGPQERAVVARVRAANPAAVAPFEKATQLVDAGDAASALAMFEAAEALAPDQPDILRRRAWTLLDLHRPDEALALAQRAAASDDSVINNASVAAAMVAQLDAGTVAVLDPGPANALLERLFGRAMDARPRDPGDVATIEAIGVELGLQTGNTELLQRWGSRAVASDESSIAGHLALAVLGASDGNTTQRDLHLAALERLHASETLIASIREAAPVSTSTDQPRDFSGIIRVLTFLGGVVGSVAAVLGAFLLAGTWVSRRSLRWLASTDPNAPVDGQEPFRVPYRLLVAASGVVYSLVLPPLALLAAIPGLLLSLLMMLTGRLPMGLLEEETSGLLAVIVHPFGRVVARIRSFWPTKLPGTPLERSEAPRLFALLDELARVIHTSPPDLVRLFPDTTMSVYETRGRRSKRVLNLGLASLVGLDATAFGSILCHELGHFLGGDTSASMTGRRVSANMVTLNRRLRRGLISVVLSAALRVVWKVHRRVTLGADRIQETLADRVAAQEFGADAFERGLRHILRRSIEFDRSLPLLVDAAKRSGHARVRSIYENVYVSGVVEVRIIDRQLERDVASPTTMYDTHPSPATRFAEARRVTASGRALEGAAFDLFDDPVALLAAQNRAVLDLNGAQLGPPSADERELHRVIVASPVAVPTDSASAN